jgi:hypothetical protein
VSPNPEFKDSRKAWLQCGDGIIILYSVDNKKSFVSAEDLLKETRRDLS